jgi:hypothetical protein
VSPWVKADFLALGQDVRDMMEGQGLTIVAAPGYRAPGTVVIDNKLSTDVESPPPSPSVRLYEHSPLR